MTPSLLVADNLTQRQPLRAELDRQKKRGMTLAGEEISLWFSKISGMGKSSAIACNVQEK
jgi:adenylylsulfate kinase-like enzyme